MNTQEILYQALLAGVLGIGGQILRIVIGIKKLNENAKQQGLSTNDVFVTSKMVVSIMIGFIAGILAWVVATKWEADFFKNKQTILGVIAAGYSGTDFIEGIMSKYLPKKQ
jgi:membrane-bound ClpP family serine protease